jgi:hypothetical protein
MEHLLVLFGHAQNEPFVASAGERVGLIQLPVTFLFFGKVFISSTPKAENRVR